ncbi:hypothetical protein PLEOSDRAFT_163832 [Pleurotus ostreatus PC15]|uniref:G-protein coupled receptors family 2 profile 2 domain-containing protein n=1 Tax=Pleurotus ostreatus (strain PC15) TaxID=1137138 RepID=A0A067N536_PLEO1|nr:hypothetical protein PLEOSDRAFT_163832 [Pleurotus ostreatus PC15]
MATEFEFTGEMAKVSNQLWMVTSVVGACSCFVVLLVIGLVSLNRNTRRHLDRVSFRIVVYALATNLAFGIVNAVGGSFTGPTWTCGFTIWILQFTLELACFLTFSIALNLQYSRHCLFDGSFTITEAGRLVIVHRVNGQRMEKFYALGSLAISLCLTIPAYATGQYGWDPLVQDCWYSNANQKERLAWQVGTQLVWTVLTCLGEVVCSVSVFAYMVKHRKRTKGVITTVSTGSQRLRSQPHNAIIANKYKNVLARIAMYPLVSCAINLTSVMCVIHATVTNGVHSTTDYRILLLSDFLYGGRSLAYAILAATDPALVSAIKASFHSESHFTKSHATSTASQLHDPMRVQIELNTLKHTHNGRMIPQDADMMGHGDGKMDADFGDRALEDGSEAKAASPSFRHLEPVGEDILRQTFENRNRENMESSYLQDMFRKQI